MASRFAASTGVSVAARSYNKIRAPGFASQRHIVRRTSLRKNKRWHSAMSLKSQNRRKSPTNEDRYDIKVFPKFVLLSVFDGHSGPAISNYSSLHFLNHLGKNISRKGPDPQVFKDTFLKFDQILHKEFPHKQDGSTVTVVYVDKHKIISANAGDSPAYIVKRRTASPSGGFSTGTSLRPSVCDAVQKITTEHDYNNERERKRVTAAGGKFQSGYYTVGNYMLQPTRGFGDFIFKRQKGNRGQDIYTALPTVREFPRTPNDKFLILATDGILLGKLNEPQDTISKLGSVGQNSPKWLLTNILKSTGIFGNPIYYPDDVTTIVVDLTKI